MSSTTHFLLALFVLTGCTSPAPVASEPKPAIAPVANTQAGKPLEHFGEPFGAEPKVELTQLLASPDAHADRTVQVEGVVRQVCQNAGCWLELATDMKPDAPGCRVVLKDHAFFVPIDSAGSSVRVAGKLESKTISAAQVAHMESEGGHFSNKLADGSALELRMIASGVELARK